MKILQTCLWTGKRVQSAHQEVETGLKSWGGWGEPRWLQDRKKRVGESEAGLLRYMGQVTMGTLALKVARINFHVNSLRVSVNL